MSIMSHAALLNLQKEVDVIQNGDNLPESSHVVTAEFTGEYEPNDVSYCEEIIICDTSADNMDNENDQVSNEIECLDPLHIPTELEVPPMVTIEGNDPKTTRYVWGGHIYTREGDSTSFICCNRQVNQCKGRVVVRNGTADEVEPHKHSRIMSKIFAAEIAKKSMLMRAKSQLSVSLRTIYDDAYKRTPALTSFYSYEAMMKLMMKARYGTYACHEPIHRVNFDIDWAKDWAEEVPGRKPKILCKMCQEYIFSPSPSKLIRHLHSKLHTTNAAKLTDVSKKQKRRRLDNSDSTDNDEILKRPKMADSPVFEKDLKVVVEPPQQKRKEDLKNADQKNLHNIAVRRQEFIDHLLFVKDPVEPLHQKRKEDSKSTDRQISQNKRRDDADGPSRYPIMKQQEFADHLAFAKDLVELPQQKRKEDPKNADQKILLKKHQDDADHLNNNEKLRKQEIVTHLMLPKEFVELPQQKRENSPKIPEQKIVEKKRQNDAYNSINYKKLRRQDTVNHMAFAKDVLERPQEKREENFKNVDQKITEKKRQNGAYPPINYDNLRRYDIVNHMAFAEKLVDPLQQKRVENPKNGDKKTIENMHEDDVDRRINYEKFRTQEIVDRMKFAKDFVEQTQQKREQNPKSNDQKILENKHRNDADNPINYEKSGRQEIVVHPTFAKELVDLPQQKREENPKNLNEKILENKHRNDANDTINYKRLGRQEIVDHSTLAKELVDPPQQKHEENINNDNQKILQKKCQDDANRRINDEKLKRREIADHPTFGKEVVDPPQQKREENRKNEDPKILRKKCQEDAKCPNIYVKLRRQDIADYLAYKKKLTEQPQQERKGDPKKAKQEILEKEHRDEASGTKNDEKSKGSNITDCPTSEKHLVEPPQQKNQEASKTTDKKISIESRMPQSISQIKIKTENSSEPTISAQVDPDQNISTESSTAQSIPQIKIKTENSSKPTLSVQVFEPSTGQPSSGLDVTLHMLGNGIWNFIDKKNTDRFGICSDFSYGENADVGFYKLNLDIYSYYTERGQKCLYPYIEIPFEVENANESFDFRIQLSPFAYNVCGNSKS
ncbi:uncharacterized protein LOC124186542 isoform X2 [Neodiprion fabricii]|uniref:uncharacterized protein LOC124186542 isoform X2 n=1 Tax=Neodiprion fabricii TaxID=2872261 RepID=UPI001ED8C44E|nr:uncharacterized protein LOC124186542 isoform X2 [Neodiprion fabricii]